MLRITSVLWKMAILFEKTVSSENIFHFFAAGETVEGLTLKGFKYPLDHYRLTTDNCGRTVSNEIQEEKAKILYEKGSLLMIMSRDLK